MLFIFHIVSDGELQGCPGTSVGGFELGGVNGAAQTVTSDGFFGEVDEVGSFEDNFLISDIPSLTQ